MVLKNAAVQGSESEGTEDTARTIANTLNSALQAGLGTVQKAVERRKEKMSIPPELRGGLYRGFRDAFIENGVPEELAEEAAADLVQNKDAESSPAISKANQIVNQGSVQQPTATLQPTPTKEAVSAEAPQAQARSIAQKAQVAENGEPAPVKKKVVFSKAPSEMTWPELQKTAKAITGETGNKPDSAKKVHVEPFVTQYWQKQQVEQPVVAQPAKETTVTAKPDAAKTVAAKPVVRTPIKSPEPALAKDYSASLKAATVDSKVANDAGQALVEGKGADNSSVISEANSQAKQATERSKLHQMYYDVLAKQKGLSTDLIELASKDLAAGKGAHSSQHIREAHDKVLNRELSKSGLDPRAQKWSKYSRHVTEQNPKKRDRLIANAAIEGGVATSDTRSMVRWCSPIAADIQKTQGGTAMAHYAESVVPKQRKQAKGQQVSTAKPGSTAKKRGQGVEVS